ncbi:hypothetical protein MSWAN_1662 [Methanobacterium paludis]|uniref:Uncharacterized protein n=2 Tax=Methanobacterium paludis (strain DSM 25820 / JCM 18151 / SWAN1) TaxID=868131 RepID=F6D2U4_METPW|nr:hypothetical protein MSWAN_1662 [Methanobacterium paludis]
MPSKEKRDWMNQNEENPCPYCYRPWNSSEVTRNSLDFNADTEEFSVGVEWCCPICQKKSKGQIRIIVTDEYKGITVFEGR